jgi:hypothetical protein
MESPTNSQQCSEALAHRLWIAGRIATLLSHYWRADDPDEILEANMRDWCDVLERFSQGSIQRASLRWLAESAGRKPTPGCIAAMARESMPRPVMIQSYSAPVEHRVPATKEEAEAIMAEFGFRVRKMGE